MHALSYTYGHIISLGADRPELKSTSYYLQFVVLFGPFDESLEIAYNEHSALECDRLIVYVSEQLFFLVLSHFVESSCCRSCSIRLKRL